MTSGFNISMPCDRVDVPTYAAADTTPKRTLYAATNTNGEWCEVKAESTSRLKTIAALALAAIRNDTTKETAA